jgi:hypothetical protein
VYRLPDAMPVFTPCQYSECAGVWPTLLSPAIARCHVDFVASLEAAIPLICDRSKPEPNAPFDLMPGAGSGKGPFLSTRDQKYFLMSTSMGVRFTATLWQFGNGTDVRGRPRPPVSQSGGPEH